MQPKSLVGFTDCTVADVFDAPVPSRRMLLLKTQAIPPRHTRFEKDRTKLPAVVTLAAIIFWNGCDKCRILR